MVNTRKNRRLSLVGKVYSPISHLLQATGNSVGIVTNTTRNIVKKSLKAVNNVGKSLTSHTNKTISNIIRRKRTGKKTRRNGRQSRRA